MSDQQQPVNYKLTAILLAIKAIESSFEGPLNRVKTLLQGQDQLLHSGLIANKFNGINDVFERVRDNEGFYSLWKGEYPRLVRTIIFQIIKYFTNLYVPVQNITGDYWIDTFYKIIYGSLRGIVNMFFIYSLDVVIVKILSDIPNINKELPLKYKGIISVYKSIYNSNGLSSLYTGFIPSILGIILYRLTFILAMDFIKPIYTNYVENKGFLSFFIFNWLITVFTSSLTYPLETLRVKMILSNENIFKIIKIDGFMSLFNGYSVYLLKGLVILVFIIILDVFNPNK